MEFDKSRVYTAVNADELKIGSKVICANTKEGLMRKVEFNEITELRDVLPDCYTNRFEADLICAYNLAYLVSEPEEKKLKWTDLKMKDVIKRGKEQAEVTYINEEGIAGNDNCHICLGCRGILTDKELEQWEKVE